MAVHNVDFDYYPAHPNQLLKDGRYKILRKLGIRRLVVDMASARRRLRRYLAVKILTADATALHASGKMRELEFLKTIRKLPHSLRHLPIIRDNFEVAVPQGSHLCLVMDLLSTDVSSFRRSAPIVRNILALVIEALVHLHKLDIVHTDVKLDDILFKCSLKTEEIDEIVSLEPLATDGEFELDGEKYPILKSQPIPHCYFWDTSAHAAEAMSVVLNDFGQVQGAGEQPTVNCFSGFSLRAPEIILRSDFGPGVDIWALGCIRFELLVGRWLFHPKAEDGHTVEDDHLALMMELTGERFPMSMLNRAYRHEIFFDEGNSLRINTVQLVPGSVEDAIKNHNIVPEYEIRNAASFIRACLRFDYKDRATAEELECHPFLDEASRC